MRGVWFLAVICLNTEHPCSNRPCVSLLVLDHVLDQIGLKRWTRMIPKNRGPGLDVIERQNFDASYGHQLKNINSTLASTSQRTLHLTSAQDYVLWN